MLPLQIEQFLQNLHRLLWVLDRMANRPLVLIDLVIVPPFFRLVPKEMNGLVVHPANLLLMLQILQAVRLIPSSGENVKGDLATNGVREAEFRELLLQSGNKLFADTMLLVVLVEVEAFVNRCITADGRDIDHSVSDCSSQRAPSMLAAPGNESSAGPIPEFHKSAPLDRAIDLADISQAEVDQLLVFVFAQPSNETRARQWLAQSEGRQAVLGEAEIEQRGHIDSWGTQLLLLLDQVRASNVTYGTLVTEGGEELQHLWGGRLFRGSFSMTGEGLKKRSLPGVLAPECHRHQTSRSSA